MTLKDDFMLFLQENDLEANVTGQVLSEIERYAKLYGKRDKLVDTYRSAVERIFSDNPHLYSYAGDIFESCFDKYTKGNKKLEEVKDSVLLEAQQYPMKASSVTMERVKEQVAQNVILPNGQSVFEFFVRDAEESMQEGVFTAAQIIDVINYALENDVKVGSHKIPALELIVDWEAAAGRSIFLKYAVDNNLQASGEPAIMWAIKNDVKVDNRPAVVYASEELGEDVGKHTERILQGVGAQEFSKAR